VLKGALKPEVVPEIIYCKKKAFRNDPEGLVFRLKLA
jgi:hypothetical protein